VPGEGYVVAWDAGSGSWRCLVTDTRGGQVGVASRNACFVRDKDVPASLEFDPGQMWEAFAQLTRKALKFVGDGDVLAISATSFRDGMVFLDEGGQVLYAGSNRDGRAVAQGFELAQKHGETIFALTGRWPLGIDGAEHLLWMHKFKPELYRRIAKVLMVSDWLVYQLCGTYSSEPSSASSSLLFDIVKKRWSPEMARLLELSPDVFPPLYSPGDVVGELSREAAVSLGLPDGLPVVVGLGDSQAACLASGAVKDGATAAIAGSTMPVQMVIGQPLLDDRHRTWTGCHALNHLWTLESDAGLAGLAYQWLWEAFGDRGGEEHGYAALNAEAEREPPGAAMAFLGPWVGDHGRLAFPAQVGFLAPFPMMLEPPLTRPRMARAVLENIAFALLGNVSQLEEVSGREVESLALCGGLTKGSIFNRIVADVCQVPVRVPEIKETSGLGAAMCAAVGAGIYADLVLAVEGMASPHQTLAPDPGMRSKYRALYKRWLRTYKKLLGR
jgi:autoinducer 2 (AI-2) kinase